MIHFTKIDMFTHYDSYWTLHAYFRVEMDTGKSYIVKRNTLREIISKENLEYYIKLPCTRKIKFCDINNFVEFIVE